MGGLELMNSASFALRCVQRNPDCTNAVYAAGAMSRANASMPDIRGRPYILRLNRKRCVLLYTTINYSWQTSVARFLCNSMQIF